MKIGTKIENTQGRYRVQIDTSGFSALEEEKLAEFGEPLIDVGSTISGSASRPGETNTTITFTPVSGGSGAVGVVLVNAAGQVTGVTITSGGSGYASGATCAFIGDGTGAAGTVVVTSGVVTSVAVTNSGEGYHLSPYPLTFALDPALRQIRSDFPVVQVFDLADYLDADIRAKIYANVIVQRLSDAKTSLVARVTPFEGETLITV